MTAGNDSAGAVDRSDGSGGAGGQRVVGIVRGESSGEDGKEDEGGRGCRCGWRRRGSMRLNFYLHSVICSCCEEYGGDSENGQAGRPEPQPRKDTPA